jgi:hypothetical protein
MKRGFCCVSAIVPCVLLKLLAGRCSGSRTDAGGRVGILLSSLVLVPVYVVPMGLTIQR